MTTTICVDVAPSFILGFNESVWMLRLRISYLTASLIFGRIKLLLYETRDKQSLSTMTFGGNVLICLPSGG